MESLRSNPGFRAELGERGHRAYRERWSPEAHLRAYFDFIDEARAARERRAFRPKGTLSRCQRIAPLGQRHRGGDGVPATVVAVGRGGAVAEMVGDAAITVDVVIPPGVWHGFQGVGEPVSILANCATEPSDPSELERLDADDPSIPYTWAVS